MYEQCQCGRQQWKEDDVFYFFAQGPFEGDFEIRGLEEEKYKVNDLFTKEFISIVDGPVAKLNLQRDGNVHLKVEVVN